MPGVTQSLPGKFLHRLEGKENYMCSRHWKVLSSLNNMSGKERGRRMTQRAFLKFWSCRFCLQSSTLPAACGVEYKICRWVFGHCTISSNFITISNRNLWSPFCFTACYFAIFFPWDISLLYSTRMPFPSMRWKTGPFFKNHLLPLWFKLKVASSSSSKSIYSPSIPFIQDSCPAWSYTSTFSYA